MTACHRRQEGRVVTPGHPDSATGRFPENKGDVGSKSARPDALAAIMRDSTIIVDARVYPVPTYYLPQSIRPLRPVPPADRGDSDEAQRVSPTKRRVPLALS